MKIFKASEEFVKGRNNISWVGSNFKEHFYSIEFSEKEAIGLEKKKLPRYMNDTAIFAEIGPEPVELGEVLAFLKVASRDSWYIFYIEDTEGVVWAVSASWDDGGWRVGANPVANPHEWCGGNHVVSRCFSASEKQTLSSSDTLYLEQRVENLERVLAYYNLKEPQG